MRSGPMQLGDDVGDGVPDPGTSVSRSSATILSSGSTSAATLSAARA
jgi:hypothetical protein